MKNRMGMTPFLLFALLLFMGHLVHAKPSFLVDSDWLSEHIEDEDLVILEVRYHPHRYYSVGHIPGAIQVQRFKDLGDNSGNPLMLFPSMEDFQATLRRWGVNDDSRLILYDDASTALASRLYYLLDLYGFNMEAVKILDGGTIEWTAFNELENTKPAITPGAVTLKPAQQRLMVEWTDIYDEVVARSNPDVVLLDARPKDMYSGVLVQHSIRGGHIPGAINIVSLEGVDTESQQWRSDAELNSLYEGIGKDTPVYVYCHDGFRMSLAYLQLKHLGYKNVRLYNGGWGHWGNRLTLPVVQGDQPYDEDFSL